jgi:hypothetical protein
MSLGNIMRVTHILVQSTMYTGLAQCDWLLGITPPVGSCFRGNIRNVWHMVDIPLTQVRTKDLTAIPTNVASTIVRQIHVRSIARCTFQCCINRNTISKHDDLTLPPSPDLWVLRPSSLVLLTTQGEIIHARYLYNSRHTHEIVKGGSYTRTVRVKSSHYLRHQRSTVRGGM